MSTVEMTEPVCNFCGTTDKNRCKSPEQAFDCETYREKRRLEVGMKQKLPPTLKENKSMNNRPQDPKTQLVEAAARIGRHVVALVDGMSARGAIKGEELLSIGQLRNDAAQMVKLSEVVSSELEAEEENKKENKK